MLAVRGWGMRCGLSSYRRGMHHHPGAAEAATMSRFEPGDRPSWIGAVVALPFFVVLLALSSAYDAARWLGLASDEWPA